MSLLTIYDNFQRVISKFRKNDLAKVDRKDLASDDLIITLDGEVVERWIGSGQGAAVEDEPDLDAGPRAA